MAQRVSKNAKQAEAYRHEERALLRPDVGTQAQFKQRKPPKTYRYDSSLSPTLNWDGQNPARELGEWLLAQIEEASKLDPPHRFGEPRAFGGVEISGLADAVSRLKALSGPFLEWAGKAERLSFDVPTLPLFVHERLSTKAILETLGGHTRDRQTELQLFADPQLPLHEQLEAYEHKGGWVNRMILGDSLVVMNSLLEYEGLGDQVQMIYIDPPYGVKFGSNFQPFVRKREVKDNDDSSMTREPEMVKAYRDTWELGLHSYLTYLRDRLFVARDLLTPSGSVFVQISSENLHHVREVLDEVFGAENCASLISFAKTGARATKLLSGGFDYLLWYAKNLHNVKYRALFRPKDVSTFKSYKYVEIDDSYRPLTSDERSGSTPLPEGARVFQISNLAAQDPGPPDQRVYTLNGVPYDCGPGKHWKTSNPRGINRLVNARRIIPLGKQLNFKRYLDDFPAVPIDSLWNDTGSAGYSATDPKLYVVQTDTEVIRRCMLMTTDPGDLVLDPTCGSGTTAYVAEQWGRRWITTDTSRVPLALARQRLLTATYPYYELQEPERGPAGGFVYRRRKNKKGEELGGIVTHMTLKAIANDEPPAEEVLVDRPESDSKITRVSGPFVVEATIPTPLDADGEDEQSSDGAQGADGSFTDRMLEVLRRAPVLHLWGKAITLKNVRPPAKSLTLSAEAALDPDETLVALLFGPENGAISEKLVFEAAREAYARSYEQLIVIGFAIEAGARTLLESCDNLVGIPASYVQATPDVVMGDLLKTMRSSQIFSVAGLPDVGLRKLPPEEKGGPPRYQAELRGLDVFDPTTMRADHRDGNDVPAWLLDTDYNELCFHVSQAFFPRTSAWDSLKRALKGEFEDSVWEHLAGTTSAPFLAGETGRIAVKVIDDRGNELLVVKSIDEAR
ncbi:MAG TPA: site-specific DNA-methyltransferase [Solirubrobacteraceae bacterium]|nr:site-specific DNA-methyltransferase [Solirubrobacteraceae bacterium]